MANHLITKENRAAFFTMRMAIILAVATLSLNSLVAGGIFKKQDQVEICDNGIDDDDDGLVDLNDTDCECILIEPLSLIPNGSFEDISCCPQIPNELQCATGWMQASFPTTDFIHTCGWLGWNNLIEQYPPPQPFPDGQGIVGFRNGVVAPPDEGPNPLGFVEPNWKEYAGACLLSPMLADSFYRLEFDIGFVNAIVSPPIVVTLFGTTDCANLPFGGGQDDPLTGCPTNAEGWVELGNASIVGGEDIWVNAAIDFMHDEDILAIAVGPDCANNLNGSSKYYYLDNLLLDEAQTFQVSISTISNPCEEDFAIEVEDHPELTYQWYKDGIALIGEITANLTQLYGEGDYQVRTMNGTDCIVSGVFPYNIPILTKTITQTICAGDILPFGDQELTDSGLYTDTLSSIGICDSVIYLDLLIENLAVDTINSMIFEGDFVTIDGENYSGPGDFLINVESPSGCDVQTFLQIEFHQVFIPNVFSPNSDGINDVFKIEAEVGLIQSIDLLIYDRWGNLMYKGGEWDGQVNNESVIPGVYIYAAEVTLTDSKSHFYSGSVTVLR